MNRIAVELAPPTAQAEDALREVGDALALMRRALEIVPAPLSAPVTLILALPTTPQVQKAADAAVRQATERSGRVVVAADRPFHLAQHREDVALVVLADPFHGPLQAAPRAAWLGFIGTTEMAQDDPGVDHLGAIRLAKVLSRLSTDVTFVPRSSVRRPHKAMIEVVRACNLECPLCPVGNGEARRYRNMSVATFARIIDAIRDTVWKVVLYNYGEPLLHPQIADIVAYAKDSGIEWVELTTNGNVPTRALASALVQSGLDLVRVSMDGATQASYERYRVGGSLSMVLDTLESFRSARGPKGRPTIEAQMVVNKFNEHEIQRFHRLARKRGADGTRLKTFNANMSGEGHADAGRSFLPTAGDYSRYEDPATLQVRDEYKLQRCGWPWERVVINADGTVVPCCYDFNGRHPLGHVSSGDDEWWETSARDSFRATLANSPLSIDMCARCPVGVPSLAVWEHDGSHSVRCDLP